MSGKISVKMSGSVINYTVIKGKYLKEFCIKPKEEEIMGTLLTVLTESKWKQSRLATSGNENES